MRRVAPRATDEEPGELARALREGEAWAERALLERHTEHVERILTRILGMRSDLDDLVQEVFVRAFQRVEELREPRALRGWLTGIAVFVAREAIRARRRKRWLSFLPTEDAPERVAPVASPETRAALRAFYEKTFIEAAPLATGVEHLLAYGAQPAAIAVDGTSVYWAEMGDGSIHGVPKDGGAAATLAPGQAGGGGHPALAAGGGKVFWTAGGPPTPGVDIVDAAGGSITTVGDPGNPSYLVADDASVYWGDYDGSIHRMGIADAVAVTLVDQASDGSAGVVAMALDNTSVYWATGDGSIRRTAK